jgi:UrcA family protein
MKNFIRTRKVGSRITLTALMACAALSTVARADDAPPVHVRYAQLDVNSKAGASMLFQRIRKAAVLVCDIPGTRDLRQMAAVKTCTDHAIAAAVEAAKLPALTAVYDARLGIAPATVVASR